MRFTKMHGLGNDYVYVNGFQEQVTDPSSVALRISDRHFGIGSDGLVLILPSEIADFRMRMFNSDGSEAQMCGNASRCVAKYIYDHGLSDKLVLNLETLAGIKVLYLKVDQGEVKEVTVDMGAPILEARLIPTSMKSDESVIASALMVGEQRFLVTCVSMGNPHAVLFVDSLDQIDVHGIGRQIENHPFFPERTNVEFVEVINRKELRMRVWERGAGETMACGTGACATLVAAHLNGLCESTAVVHLLGGDLEIEWRESNNRVYMTGGATTVFNGEIIV